MKVNNKIIHKSAAITTFIVSGIIGTTIYPQTVYTRPLLNQTTAPGTIQKPRRIKDFTTISISGTIVNGKNTDPDIPCDRLQVTISEQLSNTSSQIVTAGVASGGTTKNICKFALSYTIPKSLGTPQLVTGKVLIQAQGDGYIGRHSIPFNRNYQPNTSNPDTINYSGFGDGVRLELKPQLSREFNLRSNN